MSKKLLAASHEYAVKGNYMLIVTTLGSALLYLQAAPADQDALSEMNDLGMYMLLGFVIAVLGAVALTIIRLRIRDKKPEAPQFISIQAREED